MGIIFQIIGDLHQNSCFYNQTFSFPSLLTDKKYSFIRIDITPIAKLYKE